MTDSPESAEHETDHHPYCYQNTGVPDDLPGDLCDCRILRAALAAGTEQAGGEPS